MKQLDLSSPVSALNGIGPTRAAQLKKIGIETVYDLISYFPRTYEDRTNMTRICDITVGVPVCFRATVISYPKTHRVRKGLDITKVTVSDMTQRLNIAFFNSPYVKDRLEYGKDYYFYGTLRENFGKTMQNPQFDSVENFGQTVGRILPIYPLTAGISNKTLLNCLRQVMDCVDRLPEILPQAVREKYQLCDAVTAYRTIHQPQSFDELEQARRRLIFDEFFIFSAGLSVMRAKRNVIKTTPWEQFSMDAFLAAIPYTLTDAQNKVIRQIAEDFSSYHPMNRLVQGDVGSGKTIVAGAALYMAYRNGVQSALMVPTEILAEQHFASLGNLLSSLDMEVALLTGSTPASEKKRIKEGIQSGEIDLVIGTHALLTSDVSFANLGLVIADEQHRFGVRQRTALSRKSQNPHMLFLSATPIPRTLGLILYGDLDVSVIDELPPGRQKIDTFLVNESMRERIFAFIRKQIENKNQVYIVCPAVEHNEEINIKSAEDWADYLQNKIFPDLQVGLIHGKMKGSEKDLVMRHFSNGDIQILVATTVIEVGVDVPNATLIVIEDADRFGLSQLHQLRGRVGRGKDKSYCVLFSQNQNPETLKRLKGFCATNDGFQIAEQDLALRGPGDFFGNRQHGLPQFKVANLNLNLQTLCQAQEATQILQTIDLEADPVFEPLRQRIQLLFQHGENILN